MESNFDTSTVNLTTEIFLLKCLNDLLREVTAMVNFLI